MICPDAMSASAKTCRRWFGGICLGCAIVMLIAGQTFLKNWLGGSALVLLCYWMSCLVLTAMAAIVAIIDAARVRQETQEEQRALLETTLREIEREQRACKESKP